MFVHIVFFRFKDTHDAVEAKRRLESMADTVPHLNHIEVGIDCMGSGRSWDMVLDTRFADHEAYNAYAVDPSHQKVLAWLKTVIKESATVDYTK